MCNKRGQNAESDTELKFSRAYNNDSCVELKFSYLNQKTEAGIDNATKMK